MALWDVCTSGKPVWKTSVEIHSLCVSPLAHHCAFKEDLKVYFMCLLQAVLKFQDMIWTCQLFGCCTKLAWVVSCTRVQWKPGPVWVNWNVLIEHSWDIKISHMCIIHIHFTFTYTYIYTHMYFTYISHMYYAAIDIFFLVSIMMRKFCLFSEGNSRRY